MQKTQLTKEGFEKLELELKELTGTKRPQAVDRLSKARSMGDLSENSEYTAAKEELAFVEGRIQEIEAILKNVEIVENQHNGQVVSLGDRVTVQTNGSTDQFYIVGEYEADPMVKKLSQGSPIGRALLGRRIGDTIEVEVPAGRTSYKVLSIE